MTKTMIVDLVDFAPVGYGLDLAIFGALLVRFANLWVGVFIGLVSVDLWLLLVTDANVVVRRSIPRNQRVKIGN
ncbi:hypothetical protein KA005_08870 [bacterium]|nr:hypothetical protein [bacterium]